MKKGNAKLCHVIIRETNATYCMYLYNGIYEQKYILTECVLTVLSHTEINTESAKISRNSVLTEYPL